MGTSSPATDSFQVIRIDHLKAPPFKLDPIGIQVFEEVGFTVSGLDLTAWNPTSGQKKGGSALIDTYQLVGKKGRLIKVVMSSKKPGPEGFFESMVMLGRRLMELSSGKVGKETKLGEKWNEGMMNQRVLFSGLVFKYFSVGSEEGEYDNIGGRAAPATFHKPTALETIFKVLHTSLDYCSKHNSTNEEGVRYLNIETLRGMSTFLHERGFLFQKYFQGLAGLLSNQIRWLQDNEMRGGLRSDTGIGPRLAINCSASLCLRGGTKLDLGSISLLFNSCLAIVEDPVVLSSLPRMDRAKILKGALKAMQIMLKEDKRVFSGEVKGFVRLMLAHSFLDGAGYLKGSDEVGRDPRGPGIYSEISSSSDVYFCSDWERAGDLHMSKQRRTLVVLEAVRCCGLQLLQTVIECHKSQVLVFWENALPQEDFLTDRSLIFILLNDPSPVVRSKAHEALLTLLGASQKHIESAVFRDLGKSAFTSFSDKLGVTLHQTCLGLCQALLTEETKDGVLALLKVSKLILSHCSHSKTGQVLEKLFSQVVLHKGGGLQSSDPEIRSAAWVLLGALLGSDLKEDIKDQLLGSVIEGRDCTLHDFAWSIFGNCDLGGAERAEAANFLIAAVKAKRESFWECAKVAEAHLCDASYLVRSSLLKMMFEFSAYFQSNVDSQVEFWTCIIDDYLGKRAADLSSQVRQTICDGLGSIPSEVFTQLNFRRQRFCITLLLGYVDDEEPIVRASSFRALGQFAAFECLEEFLNDAMGLSINHISDPSLDVKARASWCLANILNSKYTHPPAPI